MFLEYGGDEGMSHALANLQKNTFLLNTVRPFFLYEKPLRH